MLKNHLVIALRHLFGNKGYFFINTLGLSMGLACSLLVFLFVRYEWTYDAFHEKADRIYRVVVGGSGFGDNPFVSANTPLPLANALEQQYPQVIRSVRIRQRTSEIRIGEDIFRKVNVLFCDPSIFEMFSFPIIEGDPETALDDVNSVVISRSAAAKYFGQTSPLGRQLMVEGVLLTVTGVAKNGPVNSSIRFDLIIPTGKMPQIDPWTLNAVGNWNYSLTTTFIELPVPETVGSLESQLPDFVQTHYPGPESLYMRLQPITDMYLDPEVQGGPGPTSDPNRSYLLICTALLVLFIACANFMNLAICRSSTRAKEVGLRKVFGAHRTQIITQHLGETAVLCCFALALGVVLTHLFLPVFNLLAGRSLVLDYLTSGSTVAALLALTGLVAVVSGSYPSLVLSRFNPIAVFRRQVQIGGPNLFIRGLMVVQFGLSALLVIAIIVMTRQLDFVRTGDLGFNPQNVVVIPSAPGSNFYEIYRNRIIAYEDILLVSGASTGMGQGRGQIVGASTDEDGNALEAFLYSAEYDYLSTLELRLVSGRDFSREFGSDEGESCIINEAAARKLGWEEPLGRRLPQGRTVIGVVRDFHFQSMHEEIKPVIFTLHTKSIQGFVPNIGVILVRISGRDVPGTLSLLEEAWMEAAPETPFEYAFMEDDIARFYVDEANLARIFTYSAVFALLIACQGVYGLVSLEVARRTREVGIRKVLGAAVSDIMGLISKQFVYLMLIANVLAWPAAWWLMNEWLADFAYRTEIGVGPFIAAGLVILAITLLTVSLQTFRSALSNPADTLGRE